MAGLTSPGLRSWGCRQSLTNLDTIALVPGFSALYLFDDGAGQIFTDRSGNGYHGTLGSSAGADASDPVWDVTGLNFEGTKYAGAAVTTGALSGTSTTQILVRPVHSAAFPCIPICGSTGSGFGGYVLMANEAGGRKLSVLNGSLYINTTPTVSGSTAIPTGTWAVVTNTGASMASVNLIRLGSSWYPDSYWYQGKIGFCAVYPFALSDQQIAQNYAYIKASVASRGVVLP